MPLIEHADKMVYQKVEATEQVKLGDDDKITLGAGPDYSIRYDSTDDTCYIRDEVNGTEVEIPKNVAMNLAAHAARHESGGADEITHNNLAITATDHHDPANQLEGESAGLREEHGESSVGGTVAATDATWDTEEYNSITVSFATAFGSAPRVSAGIVGAWWYEFGKTSTPSTSDFDLWYLNKSTQDRSAETLYFDWVAIGS